jgi:hypothetical protein
VGCLRYDYEGEVKRFAQKSWPKKTKGYTFRNMPEGSLGVGTIIDVKLLDDKENLSKKWLLAHPDSWFIDSLEEEKKRELLNKIIVPGKISGIKLDEIITDRVDFELLLPQFKKLLEQRNINLDFRTGISVTLTADEAISHRLDWTAFKEAIDNGFINKSIEQILNGNDFIIAEQDIVLINYTVKVYMPRLENPELRFAFFEAMGKNFGERAKFKLIKPKNSSGLTAAEPVVIAALWKKKGAIISAAISAENSSKSEIIPKDDLTNWPAVVIPKDRLTQFELLLE